MVELANLFPLSLFYTIVSVATAGIMGFVTGYLLRSATIIRHKKRIRYLEEEMLSNHSRILELEKQNTDLKKDKLIMNGKQTAPKTGP